MKPNKRADFETLARAFVTGQGIKEDELDHAYFSLFILCDRFGWTIQEAMEADADVVEKFLIIMSEESKHAQRQSKN